jgi:toluene monooxygenase system protein D
VLECGETAEAVIVALRADNDRLVVLDRGAYLRIHAPGRCVLRRRSVEHALGRPFRLPADLERIMPSFAGRLTCDEDAATWESR